MEMRRRRRELQKEERKEQGLPAGRQECRGGRPAEAPTLRLRRTKETDSPEGRVRRVERGREAGKTPCETQ